MNKILPLFFIFVFFGCSNKEVIPSYIYVDEVKVQGLLNSDIVSNNIYFLSVYVGDEYLGNFPLPALIPTNQTGDKEVRVYAGIKDNGIKSSLILYPFYEKLTFSHNFSSSRIDTLSLKFKYKDNTKITVLENFEVSNIFQEKLTTSHPYGLEIDTENAKYGSRCGKMHLEVDYPILEVATEDKYEDIPIDGSAVYLEIDYKNEAIFHIGILGFDQGVPKPNSVVGVNPKEDWHKIYVDVGYVINKTKYGLYSLLLGALLPRDEFGNITKDSADIYIDNVKLIHY